MKPGRVLFISAALVLVASCASTSGHVRPLREDEPAAPAPVPAEEAGGEALSPLPGRGATVVSNEWYYEQVLRIKVVGSRTEITRINRTTRITNEDPANPLDRLAGARGKTEASIITESELWAFVGKDAVAVERKREHQRTETGAGERRQPGRVESRFSR